VRSTPLPPNPSGSSEYLFRGSQYPVQSQHPPKPSSQPFTVVGFPSTLAEASCSSSGKSLESFGGAKERHDMPGDETHKANSTPSSRYSTVSTRRILRISLPLPPLPRPSSTSESVRVIHLSPHFPLPLIPLTTPPVVPGIPTHPRYLRETPRRDESTVLTLIIDPTGLESPIPTTFMSHDSIRFRGVLQDWPTRGGHCKIISSIRVC